MSLQCLNVNVIWLLTYPGKKNQTRKQNVENLWADEEYILLKKRKLEAALTEQEVRIELMRQQTELARAQADLAKVQAEECRRRYEIIIFSVRGKTQHCVKIMTMVLKPKSSKIRQVLAKIDSNKQRFSQNPDFVARILATSGGLF